MTNFQLGLGMLHASRRVGEMNALAREQLARTQEVAEHSRQTAAHTKELTGIAARIAATEQERLGVEKERLDVEWARFTADQQHRALDEQKQQQSAWAAAFLADTCVGFEQVLSAAKEQTPGVYNSSLSRKVAALQVRVHFLNLNQHVFSAFSDLKELKKLDVDLNNFVLLLLENGMFPKDPLQSAEEDIKSIRVFAHKAEALRNEYHNYSSSLLKSTGDKQPSTNSTLHDSFVAFRDTLQPKLDELEASADPQLWTKEGYPVPDLILIEALKALMKARSHDLNPRNFDSGVLRESRLFDDWRSWRLFPLRRGQFYEKMSMQLKNVRNRFKEVGKRHQQLEVHHQQAEAARSAGMIDLQTALMHVRVGNHVSAQRVLTKNRNLKNEESYKNCELEIEAWKQSLDGYRTVEVMDHLKRSFEKPISSWLWKAPNELRSRNILLAAAASWISDQQNVQDTYGSTDFGKALNAVMYTHANTVTQLTQDHQKQSFRVYLGVGLIACVLIITAIFFVATR